MIIFIYIFPRKTVVKFVHFYKIMHFKLSNKSKKVNIF